MATNSESAVCLQTVRPNTLRETDSLWPRDQEATSIQVCYCGPIYRARRVKSKGAVLVIVWNLLTWACQFASRNIEVLSWSVGVFNIIGIVLGVVMAVLYVFAGWLADVYFGRYKVSSRSPPSTVATISSSVDSSLTTSPCREDVAKS